MPYGAPSSCCFVSVATNGAEGIHQSFLGQRVADGFLDLAVAVEFQHQTSDQLVGDARGAAPAAWSRAGSCATED